MRTGEVFALTWNDIDLENKIIKINNYATQILRKGAEIRDVADILGHSRIETTENYYIASSEKTRKEANNIFEKVVQSDIINEITKNYIKHFT